MTEFPAFLKLEYQRDGAAAATLLADIDSGLGRAERRFREFSGEASRLVDVAMGKGRTSSGALDFNVAGLREFAREQSNAATAARELAEAVRTAAAAAGDDSSRARASVAATEAEAISREQAARAAREHADAIEQVQAAALRSSVDRLTGEYLNLARAEAAAADGARLLAAISSGTGLDRMASSARDSAAAFEVLFQARAAVDEKASQTFLNDAFGLERQAKSARDSAAAFQELFAAEERRAASAATLRAAIDPLYAAQQRFDQEMRTADDLLEAGAISTREYAQAQQLARDSLRATNDALFVQEGAIKQGTTANRMMVNSTTAVRQATVQAGQQLQDVAISLYSGQQATVVFAQQLPQLAFALSGLEGSANKTHDRVGRFATLLSGPWGLAVGLAAGAAVGLVSNMFDLGEETEKTKKSADDITGAFNFQRTATEELNKALDEQVKRQRDVNDVGRQSAVVAYDQAKARLASALAVREEIKALIERREQTALDVASLGEDPTGAKALTDATRSRLATQQASIDKLEQLMNQRFIPAALQLQRSPADAAFDRSLEALNREFNAKKRVTDEDRAQYSIRLAKITTDREAAEQAERDAKRRSTRGDSANRQFGREINSSEARSIAERAGFQVNSADRTNARQRELYNAWIAAGRPSDKPVAVPGTSAHERGNALDIQARPGVTAASIRKAFEDEGVRLTKLLRERNIFHVEWSTKGADRAVREADQIARKIDQLREYGERAADQIANIAGRFDEQPRLIDAAAQATRRLDDIIGDLNDKLKDKDLTPQLAAEFRAAAAEAEQAKDVIADALVRPFREMAEDSARQVEIQRLLLGGREKEAAVLSEIWRFQDLLGDLTAEQRAEIERVVLARENELEVLDRLRERQSAYLSATQSVRQELENLFAGEKADFGKIFKRLQAKITVEAIFGDSLRLLDKTVQSKFDLGADAIKAEGERVGYEFARVADAANGLAYSLTASATGSAPSAASRVAAEDIWYDLMGEIGSRSPSASNDNELVVTGTRGDERTAQAIERSAVGLSPSAYAEMLGRALVAPLLRGLPPAIAGPLAGILGGAAGGYATGGATGGILGAIRGGVFELGPDIFGKGVTDKVLKGLDGAIGGAATGTQIAGISNALGIKMNSTGAQIGGAIGSFIPIPGGQIIGSIAGGLLGGLFEKKPRGAASVTDADVRGSTNDSALTKAITGMGTDIQGAVRKIADALGADVGTFDIGLGRYKDFYQVSSKANDPKLGNSYFGRDSQFALYDGTDEAAAAAAALAEAIRDGAIKGLSATAERIFKSTPDIDAAIAKVVDFQSVFDRLRRYRDPVGAALDDLDKEFGKLRTIFKDASATTAEFAQLEELYGIERKKAIDAAGKEIIGSLQSLLDSLNIGDNGLSLRDRQANALAQYQGLETRVRGGDVTAYDAYAESARALLDIERQLFGSTQQYFDRFNEVKGLSQSVVDAQQRLTDQAVARDKGLDAGIVRDSVNSQTAVLGDKLDAVNDNLIALGNILSANGAGSLADRYGLSTTLRQ